MELGLAGKKAVVTGASHGIGLAVVRALVAEGVEVVGGARTVSAELRELAPASAALDLSTVDGPDQLVRHAVSALGALDLLVNNVGGSPPPPDEGFLALDDATWTHVFDLNFFSAVRAARAAVPSLLRTRGAIVTIASVNARLAVPRLMAYSAAKSALVNFGRALGEELAPSGVRVRTVSPGPVRTRTWTAPERAAKAGMPASDFLAALPARLGLSTGELIEPEEIAALVLLLASDRLPSAVGADYVLDAGMIKSW
ncbi:SDR family oxidoreductase [Amycolatopsis circi]|uniref:SDR family oxidoreductase n=1 Tax=Amycolatopsis circi TaxID=871959 RepID=UPI000E22F782|nr:SDR family oxidoreductase [Amycolatopsis circi]